MADDIIKRLPSRLAPDVVFSEDEDDSSSSESSRDTIGSPTIVDRSGGNSSQLQRRIPLSERKIPAPQPKDTPKSFPSLPFQCRSQSASFDEVYANTLERIIRVKALKASGGARPTQTLRKSMVNLPVQPKKEVYSKLPVKVEEEPLIATPKADENLFKVNGKAYKVLSLLGSGASCKVYSAIDQFNKTVVAIKHVDLQKADSVMIDGFRKEISYLKLLKGSDDVIQMFDYEMKKNELFLVLEKGDTDLATFLSDEKKKQNITPIMIKFYWSQMLRAVSAIHKHNIIHSDLKPANFLLVAGHLKLIDFGIAASVPTDSTSVIRDTMVGTANYMSPEAVQSICSMPGGVPGQKGPKVSVKSDVWSLGCILYNLVYGHTPFQHLRTTFQKIHAIMNPDYDIEFPPIKDSALADVLKLCLTRNPKERASVEQLLMHLYLVGDQMSPESASKSTLDCSMALPAEMMTQIQTLTPSRMEAAAQLIKRLASQRKQKP